MAAHRTSAAFATALALCCAACTSTSGSPAPTSPIPVSAQSYTTEPPITSTPTSRDPTSSAPPKTAASTRSSLRPGPPHITKPTVPADVPTSGPNTHPGQTPPVEPLVATQHTPAGAKAFAEFFVKTIDWGYATTSSTYMRHYASPTCIGCLSTAVALDKAKSQGHHFIGDRFYMISAVVSSTAPAQTIVLIQFNVTSVEVVDDKDHYIDAGPALSNFRERLELRWSKSRWLVEQFTGQS